MSLSMKYINPLFPLICSLAFVSCLNQTKPKQEPVNYSQSFNVLMGDRSVFEGLIQIRKINDPGADIVINSSGITVWMLEADTALYRPFTPSKNGYISLYSDKRIYELSYSGDTLISLQYGQGGFDKTLHHELTYHDDNIIGLTKEKIYLDLSSVGGSESDSVITDGILVLDREGNKKWSWKLTDVLDPVSYPNILKARNDWGHANSLAVDTDGHYLISWRDFNEVWKLDRGSGEVIWKYGHHNARDSSEMFFGQHSFHSTGDGSYLLFDNGNKKLRPSSRALGFTYSSSEGFVQDLSIYLPDSLFTSKQGSVYKIQEDTYLFSTSMTNGIAITNKVGDLLWYAKGPEPFYRAYYLNESPF